MSFGSTERMENFRRMGSPIRCGPEKMLPSIESMFGRELGRSGGPPVPPRLNSPPYGYPLESPVRSSGPPALTQYLCSAEDPWGTHKQGQHHHPSTPHTNSFLYQKPPDYASHHSHTNNEFPGIPGVYINRRSDRILPLSPATDTTTSYQDSISNINESGTEMYSDPGESELNSGVGDTQSQAGSSVSQMYLRQFLCKSCKQPFKCDSLRRKHEMKHTKPFKCQFPDCKRRGQGFTSANDRDRHMNSVHKRHLSRAAVGYDCVYDHCRGNGKIFWRLDNFRNHLKKKHDPNGSKEEMEEFLKRAESECRRVHPPGMDISSTDTHSEPGCPIPATPMDCPGSAMSDDFHMPRQPRRNRPPPVPRFNHSHWESASDPGGIGMPPLSPVSRGPNPDPGSDYGDRMDIDETPAPTGPVVAPSHPRAATETTNTERTNGVNGTLSQADSKAYSERQEQVIHRARAKHERRLRRLDELLCTIRTIPSILNEYETLCQEELKEGWSNGHGRQRFHLVEGYESDTSAQTMSVSRGQNNRTRLQRNEDKDHSVVHESHLNEVEENDPNRMERDDVRHEPMRHSSSHSIRVFVAQSSTEEPRTWIMSTGGTPHAAPAASSESAPAIQTDDRGVQRQLVSPPTSVASPQATVTDISQAHRQQQQSIVIPDDESPTLERAQAHRQVSPPKFTTRGRRGSPHGTTPRHVIFGSQPTHSLLPQSEKSTTCPECHKVFTMPSKLKKHMKRHSRPYACTFRGCGKLFGSKNDWKRHENSQHFQLELWKCGVIPHNSSALCGKLSFRRESHTTHLRSVHGITNKNEITAKTNEAHIGRNNFKTFWCGFCQSKPGKEEPRGRVVELTKKGLDGWDERFDHLGKHFIDQGLKIVKYVFPDDDDMYGPTQSSSDDEEDEEGLAAEPAAGEKMPEREDVLGDLCDDGDANGGNKVLTFSAPDHEKQGVELAKEVLRGPPKQLNPRANSSTSNSLWYCCNGIKGHCSDPGPYIIALAASCVACEHRMCQYCTRQKMPRGDRSLKNG